MAFATSPVTAGDHRETRRSKKPFTSLMSGSSSSRSLPSVFAHPTRRLGGFLKMTASTEEDALPPLLATREPSDTGCTDSEAISTVVPETHTATGDESTELQVEKEHEVRKARHGTAATEDLLEGSERSTKSEASQTTKTENTTPGKLEEIRAVTNRVVHETLQDSVYDQEKVNEWCETIVDSSLRGLNDLRRPYKYVVTCVIVEKAESGTHTAATAFWDQENDGLWSAHICNSTLDCFTTVFWLRNKSEYGTARSRRS